jgi:hypothetical protein
MQRTSVLHFLPEIGCPLVGISRSLLLLLHRLAAAPERAIAGFRDDHSVLHFVHGYRMTWFATSPPACW